MLLDLLEGLGGGSVELVDEKEEGDARHPGGVEDRFCEDEGRSASAKSETEKGSARRAVKAALMPSLLVASTIKQTE